MTPPVQRILLPTQPTEARFRAGRYPKRKVEWHGLVLRIENEAGSFRRGRKPDGSEWETLMHFAYGEVARTEGVDGDPVDVFLGPYMDTAPMVYVVHQRRVNDWANYDEDKAMLGFESEADAVSAFLSSYDDPRFLGPITAMTVDEFIAKAKATKEKPAMIKAIFVLSKALVGAYVRGGHMVRGYDNKRAAHVEAEGQGDLFAGAPAAARPEPRVALPTKSASSSRDPMLADFPDSYSLVEGRGELGRGKWGVADDRGRLVWNLHDTKEIAVREARSAMDRDRARADEKTASDALDKGIVERLMAGGEPTDADLAHLGLKPRAGFEYLSPVIQRLFGISKPKVRVAMGDALKPWHTDMGVERWAGDARRALSNAAAFVSIPDGHTRKHYVTMVREPGTHAQKVGWLAGPFDTNEEAKGHVDAARRKAGEIDPRSDFDAFGTSSRVAASHPPGVLNGHLGLKS